jgi:hypothetical protein
VFAGDSPVTVAEITGSSRVPAVMDIDKPVVMPLPKVPIATSPGSYIADYLLCLDDS